MIGTWIDMHSTPLSDTDNLPFKLLCSIDVTLAVISASPKSFNFLPSWLSSVHSTLQQRLHCCLRRLHYQHPCYLQTRTAPICEMILAHLQVKLYVQNLLPHHDFRYFEGTDVLLGIPLYHTQDIQQKSHSVFRQMI